MPKINIEKKWPFMTLRKAPPISWQGTYPVFNRIAIETHSKCNRRCPFCPVATGRRDFLGQPMADRLFQSICNQLADMQWRGFIELFVLNEPLLDRKLLQRAASLRSISPKSTIYISTNGDAIVKSRNPLERLKSLFESGVNSVNLNIYDNGDVGESRKQFYNDLVASAIASGLCCLSPNKYAMKPPSKNFIHISDMRINRNSVEFYDIFFDKTSEDKRQVAKDAYCARPHRHLVVLWNGIIPICCATDPTDPAGTYVGDASSQLLLDIWNCEVMMKHRYFLQDRHRSALAACRRCSHRMAYPHCVRRISATQDVVDRWREEEKP